MSQELYPKISIRRSPGDRLCLYGQQIIFGTSDLPEDLIYQITKAICTHVDEISNPCGRKEFVVENTAY
jgi:hypothetical protein